MSISHRPFVEKPCSIHSLIKFLKRFVPAVLLLRKLLPSDGKNFSVCGWERSDIFHFPFAINIIPFASNTSPGLVSSLGEFVPRELALI